MGYDFKFGGTALSEFYGVTTSRPYFEIAGYDGEFKKIPGRSGDEYIDNKRYENVVFTLKIGFIIRRMPDEPVDKLTEWLSYKHGYYEFEDTDHPGMVTYAALKNPQRIKNELNCYLKTELKFTRIPFWYQKSALTNPVSLPDAAALEAGVRLFNPYPLDAAPLIRVELKPEVYSTTGGFPFDIRFGSDTYRYRTNNLPLGDSSAEFRKYVYFDCDTGEVYTKRSDSDTTVQYADYDAPDLLKPGETLVGLASGWNTAVVSMQITPRWRRL